MEKELIIKVKLNSSFEVSANPIEKNWEEASDDSRSFYVREKVREFILENIDDLVEEILEGVELKY